MMTVKLREEFACRLESVSRHLHNAVEDTREDGSGKPHAEIALELLRDIVAAYPDEAD